MWLGRAYAKMRGQEKEYDRQRKVRAALKDGRPVVADYKFDCYPEQQYPGSGFCMNRDTFVNTLEATVYVPGDEFPFYMSVDDRGMFSRQEMMPRLQLKICEKYPNVVL